MCLDGYKEGKNKIYQSGSQRIFIEATKCKYYIVKTGVRLDAILLNASVMFSYGANSKIKSDVLFSSI